MPDDTPKAEAKLKKVGEQLRHAWEKRNPISDRSRETVRSAVREQWEKNQDAQCDQAPKPAAEKSRGHEPPEPDR